jgi:hypothetical protein
VLGAAKADTLNARDLAVRAGKAFVANPSGVGIGSGLQVVGYADYNAPTAEAFLVLPGLADTVTIGGEHAYVGVGPLGVEVVDVAEPANMKHVGSLPLPVQVRNVSTGGEFVYAVGGNGLYVMPQTMRDVP